MDYGEPWISPAGKVPRILGATALTVSVTVRVWDLLVAAGAAMVIVPV